LSYLNKYTQHIRWSCKTDHSQSIFYQSQHLRS
jgi:hypothetical protein